MILGLDPVEANWTITNCPFRRVQLAIGTHSGEFYEKGLLWILVFSARGATSNGNSSYEGGGASGGGVLVEGVLMEGAAARSWVVVRGATAESSL